MYKQIRVAVVGMPDAGKSTFIKHLVEQITGKVLSPDTLMKEVHWSDGRDPSGNPDTRTIKCAKIFFVYKKYEFCFFDCPGHREYEDQINQGIKSAHHIVGIIDAHREAESYDYLNDFSVDTFFISHCTTGKSNTYNDFGDKFKKMVIKFLDKLEADEDIEPVDIEEEAKELIKQNIVDSRKNGMFFSGGKDSAVGLSLLKDCGKEVKILYPNSGYDFPETVDMIKEYENTFGVKIEDFDNTCGKTYEKNSPFEMMQSKAISNEEIISKMGLDLVCVQYRASDEGVRSKDYHIVYKEDAKKKHFRFSPVFYFSEINIWLYIKEHNIPFCDLYLKGYRSLGDKPVTKTCMPHFKNVDGIIKWLLENPNTNERDGRTKQDKSEKYAMERLRDVGFF